MLGPKSDTLSFATDLNFLSSKKQILVAIDFLSSDIHSRRQIHENPVATSLSSILQKRGGDLAGKHRVAGTVDAIANDGLIDFFSYMTFTPPPLPKIKPHTYLPKIQT